MDIRHAAGKEKKMRKTEVTEIRKLFGINNTNIDKIVGYYVDAGGNTMATFNRSFLNLEDEEMIKMRKFLLRKSTTRKQTPLQKCTQCLHNTCLKLT